MRLWAVAALASSGSIVPNTAYTPCLAAASASAALGSNVAGIRHGPGYVSGKQTKSAPSAAARSIHCTASATLRSASPGGCEIGCTTAIRKVMGHLPGAGCGKKKPAFRDHASQKAQIVNRYSRGGRIRQIAARDGTGLALAFRTPAADISVGRLAVDEPVATRVQTQSSRLDHGSRTASSLCWRSAPRALPDSLRNLCGAEREAAPSRGRFQGH